MDKAAKKKELKGVSVASLSNPEKEGNLTKQGGSIKNWKKRWCVLQGGTFYYFKSPKATSAQGKIELNDTTMIKEAKTPKSDHAFSVCTDTRDYVIFADTEEMKTSWMEALTAAVKKKKGAAGASTGTATKAAPISSSNSAPATATNSSPSADTANKSDTKNKAGGRDPPQPRNRLEAAKDTVSFLRGPASSNKVLEFWQIWSESIPKAMDLNGGAVEFQVLCSASMQKLTWRTAGPQNVFIQKMVDFFWNVGAPETEIDRLNDVGALINPVRIGSWIDMSEKGGMDGGWYFPCDITIANALEAADPGPSVNKVKEWATKHRIDKCLSVGRDMGAAPPRQTEMRVELPGTGNWQGQLDIAMNAFEAFNFPTGAIPEAAVKAISAQPHSAPICLSIITSEEGFVRLGILFPNPSKATVGTLCEIASGKKEELLNFEKALGSNGPDFVELQYLMKGFGYSVYKEGFDVVIHYHVGEEGDD